MFEYVDMSSKFSEVKAYVRDGLPQGHWSCDNKDIEGGRPPPKMWLDTNKFTGEHRYDQYHNDEVKNAARFRDGLVNDINVYTEFEEDFRYSYWAEEYKQHSEIVYRHLRPLDVEADATSGENGLNIKSLDQINLMQFHIESIEGYQSQSLMRDKIFSVLYDDIQKLPKTSSKERSSKSQVKYVEALAVVLSTIVNERISIGWKVYSSKDFDSLFDATARVQNVMTLLIKDEIFDDVDVHKVFIFYHRCIRLIDEMNNQWVELFEEEDVKKKRFFTSTFLTKLLSMEKSLILKYGKQNEESGEGDEDEIGEGNGKSNANGDGGNRKSEEKEEEVKKKGYHYPNTASSSSTATVGSKRKNEHA